MKADDYLFPAAERGAGHMFDSPSAAHLQTEWQFRVSPRLKYNGIAARCQGFVV